MRSADKHTADGQGNQTEALHCCTWCGHVHDPEDGRCDAHAHVGIGRCRCPGDLRTLKYDRERVRRRIAAAMSGRGYSVMEMAADLERYATHPVWEQAERLDDEVERLRSALEKIADCEGWTAARRIARSALSSSSVSQGPESQR